MRILAVDPGPTASAFVEWETGSANEGPPRIIERDKASNQTLREHLLHHRGGMDAILVVEMIASYGMAVGAEVFETVFWIGRFVECWPMRHERMFRRTVKLHLCNSAKAKDANIRLALIDRFGGKEKAIGRKASPGPLYGISGDIWSALAVAITYADTNGAT